MKKFSKILVLALSLAVIISAFAFASSAEDAPFLVEGLHRDSWADAIDNADADTPVELLNNYNVQNGETVEVKTSVKINLNGFTLNGAEDGAPLFNVVEEGVVLTISGPGKINLKGTLAALDVSGSKLVVDGTEPIEFISESGDSVFVVGGENKAKAELKGTVNFKNKLGANLFELRSGSELTVAESLVKITVDGATQPSGLAIVASGSSVDVTAGAVVTNTAGHIFKVEDTDASTSVKIKIEGAKLVSESATYGTIVELGAEYATVTARVSELSAGGYAFNAADTVAEYTGSGLNKEYAKPTASVSLTSTDFTVANISRSDATIFYGNVTGVIAAGKLTLNNSNRISYLTRLWDGECGVLIKAGVRLNVGLESELAAPMTDSDGVKVYFNPDNTASQNFSLDSINGQPTKIYQTEVVNSANVVESFYIVGVGGSSYSIDQSYSTNFEDVATVIVDAKNDKNLPHKILAQGRIKEAHSSAMVLDNADGTNRYFKLEYDKNKTYAANPVSNAYFSLKLGYGSLGTVPQNRLQYNQEFITFDFDISSDTANPDGTASYYNGSFYLMQRNQGSGWAWHTSDNFKIENDGTITCGKVNLLDKTLGVNAELSKEVGVWTHITIVLDIRNDSTYDYRTNSMMHFYVNGEYKGSDNIFNSSAWDLKEEEIKKLTSDEFRLSLGSTPATSRSLCIDNMVQTFYPDGYTGDLLKIRTDKSISLTDIGDAIYQRGYAYPDGVKHDVVANVDGVDYYIMDSALAAISEGSIVELYTDVPGTFTAKNSFTVNTNGYKFDVNSATHYVYKTVDEAGKDVIDLISANNYLPIYWDIGVSYETKVPLGIAPEYTGAVPEAVISNGTKTKLIGWSYTEGAKVPDKLRPVSKEDIDRGYIILYPVYDITEILVSFKDLQNEVYKTEWVSIVDENYDYPTLTLDILNDYNNGSDFGKQELNSWLYTTFGGWVIEGSEETTIGREALTVVPVFSGLECRTIKQSYAIENLSKFIPKMFVEAPADDLEGITVLGAAIKEGGKYVSMSTVKFDGKTHYTFDLGESAAAFAAVNGDITVYLDFEVDSVKYTQKVELKLDAYFEKLLGNSATDVEKTAIMNMFRMIHMVTEASKGKHSDLVDSYLANPDYQAYLTDLDSVKGTAENTIYRLYTNSETNEKLTNKQLNDLMWNGDATHLGLENLVSYINWDFASNTISIQMNLANHPLISGAYSTATPGLFVSGGVIGPGSSGKLRCSNGGNMSKGLVTLTLAHSSYDTDNEYAFNAFSDIYINFDGEETSPGVWNRTSIVPGSYYSAYGHRRWNLAAQISHLAARIENGETGLETQYEQARIMYIAHWSMGEVLNQDAITHTPFLGK